MNHSISVRTYLKTYFILMGLLALTVAAAYVHLGPLNAPVSLLIAIVKALLVILIFMHARFNSRLVWIYAAIGFVWLAMMIGGTLADFLTR